MRSAEAASMRTSVSPVMLVRSWANDCQGCALEGTEQRIRDARRNIAVPNLNQCDNAGGGRNE